MWIQPLSLVAIHAHAAAADTVTLLEPPAAETDSADEPSLPASQAGQETVPWPLADEPVTDQLRMLAEQVASLPP